MNQEFSDFTEEEMEVFHKKVGEKVRSSREAKGISQLDLALSVDIRSVAFFSNCENR